VRYLRYLKVAFRMSIFRSVEYRSGVFIQYLLDAIWYFVQFALLRTAYAYVPSLGGYSLADAYVFLAFLFTTDAISMTFFNGGIDHFTRSIRTGGLDFYLLRPMPTLYQMTVARVSLAGLLNFVFTTAFWVFVLVAFNVHYPFERWIWASLLLLNGALINATFRLCLSCAAFWTTEGGTLGWLYHELMRFGSKPESVYGRPYRYILSSIIPSLLLNAWPCMVLVRETTLFERTFPFGVGAASVLALLGLWKIGVKRYEGLSFSA
jgi:ABC-2 type transport system permease protein